jgi:hypothetical protein
MKEIKVRSAEDCQMMLEATEVTDERTDYNLVPVDGSKEGIFVPEILVNAPVDEEAVKLFKRAQKTSVLSSDTRVIPFTHGGQIPSSLEPCF